MATYSPQQLGINASTTGGTFQQGAWYNSRQYWNGSLSEPGTIHPESNQQGAGQKVSQEVNRQSSVAAGKAPEAFQNYINAGAPITGYNSAGDVQNALNGVQNGMFTGGGGGDIPGVQTPSQIAADLRNSGLLPTNSAPSVPNSVQTYNDLAKVKGVEALQGAITDLTSQADSLVAQTRTNTSAERGKPVATNIVEGRDSTQKTQAQEQLDFINRQLTVKQNELNSTLGNIKLIMDLTQQDYQNASNAYNTQFDQAIATINLVHGIQQDQKTDVQRAQDNARANAQIMYNAIREGGISMQNLPPDQMARLNSLEVQSGLPVGFFSALRTDPKANIISTSTDNGVTQVLMRNGDGSISVQKYGTSTAGSGGGDYKPGTAQYVTAGKQAIVSGMQAAANSYGDVSPATWNAALNAWIGDGLGTKDQFVSNFSTYADQNRGDFEKAYGFSKD